LRQVGVGAIVIGQLGLNSLVAYDPYGTGAIQSFAEDFALPVHEGDEVTVTLESRDFDPVLDAGAPSPLGFAVAVTNDDGGGGRSSRLLLRARVTGTIYLRARAIEPAVGQFVLTVRPGNVPPPRGAGPGSD
jgi:hypothetical protein